MMMLVKRFLRKRGYDVVRYHSVFDALITPIQPEAVLDIGANSGAYARATRERFPHARIHSFEPLHECQESLSSSLPKDSLFTVHPFALGNSSGETVIHHSSFNPSSSLRPMAELHKQLYPKSAGQQDETIRIERLDDIAASLSLPKTFIAKLDVQGFEDQVMEGGKQTLSRASALILETSFVPLYEGQPLFKEIFSLLTSLGFEYRGRLETHYSRLTGEPIYEDAVFLPARSKK